MLLNTSPITISTEAQIFNYTYVVLNVVYKGKIIKTRKKYHLISGWAKGMQKRKWLWLSLMLLLLVVYWNCLPYPLFDNPTSIVLTDSNDQLLGARIAKDGQWRFPHRVQVPEKFERAIITFEDKRFHKHFGIDLIGLGRAIRQNMKAKTIVSGGSTISMQVMRMARNAERRSVWNKLIEMVQATRLEIKYTKQEILALYASNAPFGGNVVGLETAAWRYFGKAPELLSWSEAATLAILPNAPALIHPGRNRSALLAKRNRLLKRLLDNTTLDSLTYQLALNEPLPEKPLPLPQLAPHLLDRISLQPQQLHTTRYQTTLDNNLQAKIDQVLQRHYKVLKSNGIHNAAVLVADVETAAIRSYHGNIRGVGKTHEEYVDVIPAPRSTGSILKPLLYASVLDEGLFLPQSLVPDVPTMLSGYRPENFNEQYDGVVSTQQALVRSLNVPIIRMLQAYGLEKFHFQLQKLGFKAINQSATHYGLPLALGGAEVSLEELVSVYASLARTVNHFADQSGQYNPADFKSIHFLKTATDKEQITLQEQAPYFKASSLWLMLEAMKAVERPTSEGSWETFQSSRTIAWKTGTSFGFRDAWAIGLDSKYIVGVWVGNADGEGRPGLVGVKAAAPILFDVFKLLPSAPNWFDPPYDELLEFEVCSTSGYRPTIHCPKDTVLAPQTATNLTTCPYHKKVFLDSTATYQVWRTCAAEAAIVQQPWFVLPPIEAFYYKTKHPNYEDLPPYAPECTHPTATANMELIYPRHYAKIAVPKDYTGALSSTVFKVAHRNPTQAIHWHLDETYIGTTTDFHEMELQPTAGKHQLSLVDATGERLERTFEVVVRSE